MDNLLENLIIAPYRFMGDNELTGVYFGWRRTGEYWFTRYHWVDELISGFSFLPRESVDIHILG
jgi:hypothetical protein